MQAIEAKSSRKMPIVYVEESKLQFGKLDGTAAVVYSEQIPPGVELEAMLKQACNGMKPIPWPRRKDGKGRDDVLDRMFASLKLSAGRKPMSRGVRTPHPFGEHLILVLRTFTLPFSALARDLIKTALYSVHALML